LQWQNANLTADTEASRHGRCFGDWNQNGGQAMPYLNSLCWLVFAGAGWQAESGGLLTGAPMWGSSSTDPWPFRERLGEGFF